MRKRKFWSLALMLLLVLSTALAACSSDAGDGKKRMGKQRVGLKTVKHVQDILVFGRGGDSTSLDPSRVTEGETFKVTVNLYETLLNFGEQDTTINPGLAKEWEPSEAVMTW